MPKYLIDFTTRRRLRAHARTTQAARQVFITDRWFRQQRLQRTPFWLALQQVLADELQQDKLLAQAKQLTQGRA